MSYCRFSKGSDVYLFKSSAGWECCACRLHDEPFGSYVFDDLLKVKIHLGQHLAAGHKVPKYALDRVDEELKEANDG